MLKINTSLCCLGFTITKDFPKDWHRHAVPQQNLTSVDYRSNHCVLFLLVRHDFKVTILFNVRQHENGTRQAMVTMADQQKIIHGPSNRVIVNDLERPQTQISRSDHSLMLNISEMAKVRPQLLWKANSKPYPSFQMVPFSVTYDPHFKVMIIFNVK